MWKCCFCGEQEPLEFQRGHLAYCKAVRPEETSIVPATEVYDATDTDEDCDGVTDDF